MGVIRVHICHSFLGVVALLLFSFTLLSVPATAGAPVQNFLQARAEVVSDGLGNPPVIDIVGDPVVASDSLTNGGVTSTASAEATYGILKASAEITKGPAIEPFNFATGSARFADTLTISGGTGTADISFAFQLDGLLQDINAGESRAQVEFTVFLPETFQLYNETFFVESGNSRAIDDLLVTPDFIFDYDVPFQFQVDLIARVSLEESDDGSASSQFDNTAVLTGLTVSSGGVPVSGATISTSSGTNYPIPEPASGLMLLLGTWTLSFRRRS